MGGGRVGCESVSSCAGSGRARRVKSRIVGRVGDEVNNSKVPG